MRKHLQHLPRSKHRDDIVVANIKVDKVGMVADMEVDIEIDINIDIDIDININIKIDININMAMWESYLVRELVTGAHLLSFASFFLFCKTNSSGGSTTKSICFEF